MLICGEPLFHFASSLWCDGPCSASIACVVIIFGRKLVVVSSLSDIIFRRSVFRCLQCLQHQQQQQQHFVRARIMRRCHDTMSM